MPCTTAGTAFAVGVGCVMTRAPVDYIREGALTIRAARACGVGP
jgi:hypothetical protein